MTKTNNTTKSPVSYEIAKRFVADFNFCHQYWENYADDIMNGSETPAHGKVLGQMMSSLLESSDLILDALHEAHPAEFFSHCSSKPQRQMTEQEKELLESYLSQ